MTDKVSKFGFDPAMLDLLTAAYKGAIALLSSDERTDRFSDAIIGAIIDAMADGERDPGRLSLAGVAAFREAQSARARRESEAAKGIKS